MFVLLEMIVDMLDKRLDKIKMTICIETFHDIKILFETNDNNDITRKDVVILITCVIKDEEIFYPLIFLEEALVVQNICSIDIF